MNQKQVEAQPVLVQKKHGGNRGLIGLLCALGVIIVGLVVAIVVVKVNENGQSVDSDSSYEITQEIGEKFSEEENVETLISEYRTSIDAALAKGDQTLANELISDRSSMLILGNYCDMAIELLNSEDVSGFNSENRNKFYGSALSAAVSCANDEYIQKWRSELIGGGN